MVQNLPAVSIDRQQLARILGTIISDRDSAFCLDNLAVKHPDAGEQFWQSKDDAGIYTRISHPK